jgi:hypothetical protein
MKDPFDPARAAFWLVAAVILTHLALTALGAVMCALNVEALIASGKECPAAGKILEVLGAALAASLAFAGGKGGGKD